MNKQPNNPAHVQRFLDGGRNRTDSPYTHRMLSDREMTERAKNLGREAAKRTSEKK